MKINLINIPLAIIYFLLGTLLNVIVYYTFSPNEANILSILGDIVTLDASTISVIWIGIMAVSLTANLLIPIWTLVEKDE